MVELNHCSTLGVRRPLRALLLGLGVAAAVLGGCGARSSVDLLEGNPARGTGARANAPDPALPTAGAGSPAFAGSPSVGGSPAQAGAPNPPPPACEAVTVAFDELRPALTLVVDQSLSMRFHYPDDSSPATRWSLVGDALFNPMFGVVKQFEASVRFGIAFFTSHPGNCPILNEV